MGVSKWAHGLFSVGKEAKFGPKSKVILATLALQML